MGSHTLQQLRGYSFDEIKELFETTMKRVNTFVPMETKVRGRASELAAGSSQATITDSAEVGSSKRAAEAELDHEGSKRQKTNEASGSVQEQPDEEEKELSQEDLQQMMMVVPVEEVYKIIRVGNHTEAYQFFDDMLKVFDRDDLVMLWSLVKERFSSTEPTDDKERTLWVELKRLFEPDTDDTLWKLQRYMHDPLTWRLYDTCGVHHVSTEKGMDIFMLVEKEYPLSKRDSDVDHRWFNSEKLVDLNINHKFKGGLLEIKLTTLSAAKGRIYTAKLSCVSIQQIDTAYSDPLDTAYQPFDTVAKDNNDKAFPCNLNNEDDTKQQITHGSDNDMKYDPSNVELLNGGDEVEPTNEESSDSDDEDEVAKIFRIDANISILKILIDLRLTKNIRMIKYMCGIKTYHGYMKNHGQTMEYGKNPLLLNIIVNHSRLKVDIRNGQLVAGKMMDIVMDNFENTNRDHEETEYEMEHEDEERCESFNDTTRNAPVCNIRRFEMIKYSFGEDEEYVAIKEHEYDDLTSTNEDACRTYQEIFRRMDEGWMVTRAE
ncbi:hypothetical protein Tco_0785268 [Tanacetum coccineum]